MWTERHAGDADRILSGRCAAATFRVREKRKGSVHAVSARNAQAMHGIGSNPTERVATHVLRLSYTRHSIHETGLAFTDLPQHSVRALCAGVSRR